MLSVVRAVDSAPLAGIRNRDFPDLDNRGECYLDYTGSALPARSQLEAQQAIVRDNVFGNPHSAHLPSQRSGEAIERARARLLSFVDADPDEYAVVFTANASAAIKLVAESFPFSRAGALVLSQDNHNSVNGIGEYAVRSGARLIRIGLAPDLRLSRAADALAAVRGKGARLFAFPAQSNFSGVRHPLSLIAEARDLGYSVLLDAAAFAPTSPLSLTEVAPDFVALSMYKMFGFPAGVGALIARHEALAALRRPWFAGGTVEWVSTTLQDHRLAGGAAAFEDGTANFTGIAAVPAGLDYLDAVGMRNIAAHVGELTIVALDLMRRRRHANGRSIFKVYGPLSGIDRGGTIAFNVLNASGATVSYEQVEAHAARHDVSLRGGCFCNPGASEAAFELSPRDMRRCLDHFRDAPFFPRRLGECLGSGATVGALRLSVGLPTTASDIERAIEVLSAAVGA